MMKYMFTIFIIIICVGCGNALQNSRNLNRLKLGMNVKVVDSIMGPPLIIDTAMEIRDPIDSTWKPANTFKYEYESGIGASDYYVVIINKSDSCVEYIGYGD